ncbi:arginase family protein [Natrinema gelatinilyticum]|uniref:arginase family protein n=1 Tax=Natrinema gelatinilyticum TaxID=2961571 RepID=UPI003CE4A7EA
MSDEYISPYSSASSVRAQATETADRAPGTRTPIAGGLAVREARKAMEVLGTYDAVSADDMMEVAPEYTVCCKSLPVQPRPSCGCTGTSLQ